MHRIINFAHHEIYLFACSRNEQLGCGVTLAVKNIQIRASFHICLIKSLNAQMREKNLALCSEDYY